MRFENMKVGIIGCGNIAKVHFKYISRYIGPGNIALCDRDRVRLEDFAKNFAITNQYDDLSKMFSVFKPDVVHILTPPPTHKAIAIQCLSAGAHVLIEKPMCLDEKEADEIIAVAKEKGLMACTSHMRMYDPLLLRVREMFRAGDLGEIKNIYACYSHDLMEKIGSDSTAKWMGNMKGGVLFDVSPHLVYILEEFLPGLKFNHIEKLYSSAGDITDIIALGNSPAGTGVIQLSLTLFPLQNYVRFDCTRGMVKIDFRNFIVTVRKRFGLPNAVERIVGNISVGYQIFACTIGSIVKFLRGRLDSYGGTDVIIRKFYAAITNKTVPPVPAEKGKALARLTHQIFSDIPGAGPQGEVRINTLKGEADVLVTGGTGFVGKPFVRRLAKSGRKIRLLTNQDPAAVQKVFSDIPELDIVKGDIYRYDSVKNACRGVNIVYHLAAAMKGDWNYFLDTTITGTINMLRAVDEAGVKKLVYVSTLNVLDAKSYPHNGVITEEFQYEDHPERRGSYSHAKLRAERLVLDAVKTSAAKIVLLRPGLVFGPGGALFPKDVGIRLGKKLVVCLGMGTRKIPFVYVDNLADALLLAADIRGKSGSIYNVVDEEYPTQKKYMKCYKKLTGESFLTVYIPFWFIVACVSFIEFMLRILLKKKIYLSYKFKCIKNNVVHSTAALKRDCGWEQKVHFCDGLETQVIAVHRTTHANDK